MGLSESQVTMPRADEDAKNSSSQTRAGGLTGRRSGGFDLGVSTETEILAAVDAMPARRKARLMPKLRQRLEDFYDLQAVKRAREKGVYHDYEGGRRK